MSKHTNVWTFITAILAALVYIDIFYFYGVFFVTIPLTILSAVISMIVSFKQKQYFSILLNLLFVVIAVISFILFP